MKSLNQQCVPKEHSEVEDHKNLPSSPTKQNIQGNHNTQHSGVQ